MVQVEKKRKGTAEMGTTVYGYKEEAYEAAAFHLTGTGKPLCGFGSREDAENPTIGLLCTRLFKR